MPSVNNNEIDTSLLLSVLHGKYKQTSIPKILEEYVLVQIEEKNDFAYLFGVDRSYSSVVQIDSVITLGKWLNPLSKEFEAVVSYDLADNLNLGMYNYGGGLTVVVPSKKSKNNLFKKTFSSYSYMVSGLFSSNEPDKYSIGHRENQDVEDLWGAIQTDLRQNTDFEEIFTKYLENDNVDRKTWLGAP